MDTTEDAFRTLRGEAHARIKVLGSTFLGTAASVQTLEEAEEFIRRRREEHFDATHHCYAYRLGIGGDRYRLHDDGEPGGTGGRPILTAIDRAGLTDVVLVVTRWFGGTKLGVGGLARAYGRAAEQALAAGVAETRYRLVRIRISFPHEQTSAVMHVLSLSGARIAASEYDEAAHLLVELRASSADLLTGALVDATRGQARIGAERSATDGGVPEPPSGR